MRRDSLGAGITCALLLTGLLVVSITNVADPDLWGHVRYGEDVLVQGQLPRTATHTFTATGYPWVNHENLSELIFALVVRAAGGRGLTVLKWLLALAVFGMMLENARRKGASVTVAGLSVLLAAFNMAPGWTVRPQLFSYVFFAILGVVLERASSEGSVRWRTLFLLPPLFALWSNTHGGVVAGLGVTGLYLGTASVQALWRHGREGRRQALGYALALLASLAALLVTPYGVDYVPWLARAATMARPEISEWRAVSPADLQFVPFVLLGALVLAAWVGSDRPRRLPQAVVLLVVAWQSWAHVRHIPFFAILAGLWVPDHAEALWRRARGRRAATSIAPPVAADVRRLQTVTWVAVGMLAIALLTRLREPVVDRSKYPVDALRYVSEQGLTGKLVVHFDWAQYAIAALAPAATVGFDGRFETCYPQEVVDIHFDFLLGDLPDRRSRSADSPPVDGARVLTFGQPDLVLLSREYPHAVETMRARADWVLLYQDGLAQLWGGAGRYDRRTSPDYLPPTRRMISDRPQTGWIPWPALPSPEAGAEPDRPTAPMENTQSARMQKRSR